MSLFPPAFSFSALHRWLARRRAAALVTVGLLWLLAAWLGSRATLDTTSLSFFPDSDPEMARMAQAMDMAPFSRLLLVDLAAPQAGQAQRLADTAFAVFDALPDEMRVRLATARGGIVETLDAPQALLAMLPALTDEATLAALEAAVRPEAVDSAVRRVRDALSGLAGLGGDRALSWLLSDPLQFRSHVTPRLPQPPQAALLDPVLGLPVSADGRHVLLALRPASSLHDVDAAVKLMDALDTALKAHVPPDITVTMVGGHRHSAANTRTINNDIQRIVVWSLAGFVLVYALLVRSFSGAFWLLLTPLAAASGALGALSLCWPVISGLALGFGASVLGIAEDYAVHMHFALRCARGQGMNAPASPAPAVLDLLALPLAQGFLLNISGFAVLLFSGIPALRQLAAFALLTLTAGLLLALVVLPLCPGFDRPVLSVSRSRTGSYTGPAQPAVCVPRFPRRWLPGLCAAALLSLCAFVWPLVPTDVTPRGLGADMAAMQRDADSLRAVWQSASGADSEELWVVEGADWDEAVTAAEHVAAHLRKQGRAVDSLSDFRPSKAVMYANMARWEAFVAAHPELPAQLAQAAQKYGFAADAFAPFSQFFTAAWFQPIDGHLLISAGLTSLLDTFADYRYAPGDRAKPLGVRVLILGRGTDNSGSPHTGSLPKGPEALDGLAPQWRDKTTALSPAALTAALERQWREEEKLLPVAALLCTVLLFACFRRVPPTLLASLPALAGLAAILGWLAGTGTPLTLAGMATLPLVMGLALDHGVVVTHDLALGKHLGVDRAVVTSSLTALTGMGLLALAEHPALRSMGQIIFPGLVMEMLVALWLLPRLCAPKDVVRGEKA